MVPGARIELARCFHRGILSFSPDPAILKKYQFSKLSLPAVKQVDSVSNAESYNRDMFEYAHFRSVDTHWPLNIARRWLARFSDRSARSARLSANSLFDAIRASISF